MSTFPHRLRTILSAALVAGALVLALPAVSSADSVDAGAAAPAAAQPTYVLPVYRVTLHPVVKPAAKPAIAKHRAATKAKRHTRPHR